MAVEGYRGLGTLPKREMTAIKKKKYHHGDLRQALLTAASTELEQSGIEGFSLRKVAKRAGVSHAAPAHHFGDANGLLTALAAEGYQRFIDDMKHGERGRNDAATGAGFGYIAFAAQNPALFRLIFASDRPNYEDETLAAAGEAAFRHLCGLIQTRTGTDPFEDSTAMEDAMALWAMAHGLADLLGSGRMGMLQELDKTTREAVIGRILSRALPSRANRG